MGTVKLKKISWSRKRFARSSSLLRAEDWIDTKFTLQERLKDESHFQIIEGFKNIVEVDLETGKTFVLIEVVGVIDQSILTFDLEPVDVLVYESINRAHEVNFSSIETEARAIMAGLASKVMPKFHIVFDGNNLALHFFIQKDYIHSM